MVRIAGVDLPKNKSIHRALTNIYGIGVFCSKKILLKAQVDLNKRSSNLSESDVAKIRKAIETSIKVEGDLRNDISMNIKRLIDLGCYRGIRHRKGLPVRGQRTHSNANTKRIKRKFIIRKRSKAGSRI